MGIVNPCSGQRRGKRCARPVSSGRSRRRCMGRLWAGGCSGGGTWWQSGPQGARTPPSSPTSSNSSTTDTTTASASSSSPLTRASPVREEEGTINSFKETHFVVFVGYRDDSLETVKRNEIEYEIPLKILSYKELYGWTMDDIVREV